MVVDALTSLATVRVAASMVVAWALCLVGATALATSDSDVARAEREIALREMARGIFERAEARAKDAVRASSAHKKLVKDVREAFDECNAVASEITEAGRDRRKSIGERQAWLAEGVKTRESCMDLIVEMSRRNDGLIAELRDQFIAEELDALRTDLEESEFTTLESAVGALAI